MALTVTIPYEDYSALVKDASDRANIIRILSTEFPDDTCQLIAIKSILEIGEKEEEPTEPPITDPIDPPSDPSGDGDTQEGDTNEP